MRPQIPSIIPKDRVNQRSSHSDTRGCQVPGTLRVERKVSSLGWGTVSSPHCTPFPSTVTRRTWRQASASHHTRTARQISHQSPVLGSGEGGVCGSIAGTQEFQNPTQSRPGTELGEEPAAKSGTPRPCQSPGCRHPSHWAATDPRGAFTQEKCPRLSVKALHYPSVVSTCRLHL